MIVSFLVTLMRIDKPVEPTGLVVGDPHRKRAGYPELHPRIVKWETGRKRRVSVV